FHGQGLVLLYRSGAVTDVTGILDGLASTAAARAGLLHGERPLAHAHLAHAVAGHAVFRRRTFLRTAAITGLAGDAGRNTDLDAGAAHRVFQGQLQGVADVGAALDVAAPAPAAKDVPEDIAENVTEP